MRKLGQFDKSKAVMNALNLLDDLRRDCGDRCFWILTSTMDYLADPTNHGKDGDGSTVQTFFTEWEQETAK